MARLRRKWRVMTMLRLIRRARFFFGWRRGVLGVEMSEGRPGVWRRPRKSRGRWQETERSETRNGVVAQLIRTLQDLSAARDRLKEKESNRGDTRGNNSSNDLPHDSAHDSSEHSDSSAEDHPSDHSSDGAGSGVQLQHLNRSKNSSEDRRVWKIDPRAVVAQFLRK